MISGLENLSELTTLDVAYNKIEAISGLDTLAETLEEFWINFNVLGNLEAAMAQLHGLKKLKTIYVADNPMVKGVNYLELFKDKLPHIEQIDGYMLKQLFNVKGQVQSASIVKNPINPKAKQILEDVLMKNT